MYAFLRFPGFKRKAVTLSYDDGVRADRRLIAIMDRNGLKGTFNINSGLFGNEEGVSRLTKEEVLKLYGNSCHEVAVHGSEHFAMTEVDLAVATRDILTDREKLEELFGGIVQGMAYANGSATDEIVEVLKCCGIKYARTAVCTEDFKIPGDWLRMPSTCHHTNPRMMELARKFVEDQGSSYYWSDYPLLFTLRGHSSEFDDNNNWEIMEEFASYMGGREDIWYATNGEIYDYVQAYDRLVYSANGKIIRNPTDQDVYLCYHRKHIRIPASQTVRTD